MCKINWYCFFDCVFVVVFGDEENSSIVINIVEMCLVCLCLLGWEFE